MYRFSRPPPQPAGWGAFCCEGGWRPGHFVEVKHLRDEGDHAIVAGFVWGVGEVDGVE